jgi:hypothetical protein
MGLMLEPDDYILAQALRMDRCGVSSYLWNSRSSSHCNVPNIVVRHGVRRAPEYVVRWLRIKSKVFAIKLHTKHFRTLPAYDFLVPSPCDCRSEI